jgi:hypothetical protein
VVEPSISRNRNNSLEGSDSLNFSDAQPEPGSKRGSPEEDEWVLKKWYDSQRHRQTTTNAWDYHLEQERRDVLKQKREEEEWETRRKTWNDEQLRREAPEPPFRIVTNPENSTVTPGKKKKQENRDLEPTLETHEAEEPEQYTSGAIRKERRRQRIQKARSPASEAIVNEVRVSLGSTQVQVPVGPGAEVTVIHPRAWEKYIEGAEERSEEVEDYETYRASSRTSRKKQRCIREVHGKQYGMHGPYVATLVMEGFHIYAPVYVASTGNFPYKIVLGEDIWVPQVIEMVHNVKGDEHGEQETDERTYDLNHRANTHRCGENT